MRRTTCREALAIIALFCIASTSQGVEYQKEFDKKIKASQNVAALGDDLAGDRVNLLDGTVTFATTDASLPGNNALGVALGRTFRVEFDAPYGLFADWDIDVPYIGTVMTADGGWIVDSATPTARCSVAGGSGMPPVVVVPEDNNFRQQTYAFYPFDYFHGYTLHLPSGEQSLLVASTSNTQRPQNGKTYHWTTNQNWWFSCLGPTAASGNGEGFEAIAPDGTIYTFDRLSGRSADDVTRTDSWEEVGMPQTFHFTLPRAEYRLYASQVTDRFGNWVKYNWSGNLLTSITSSDGRTITLSYTGGLVSSVSDGMRTWSYTYSTVDNKTSLSGVSLPDGSAWTYSLRALAGIHRPEMQCTDPSGAWPAVWDCYGGGAYVSSVANTGYVIHPSGARVDFNFDVHFQYSANSSLKGSYPLALVQKRITGPGLSAATWKYGFAPSAEETKSACRGSNGCPLHVVTDQLNPDGTVVRRVFDKDTLLQTEFRGAASASTPSAGTPALTTSARFASLMDDPSPLLGSTTPVFYQEFDLRYAPSTETMPYKVLVGTNPSVVGENFATERRLPLQTRILKQQGATFTRNVELFNAYAQPERVTRSSSGLVGTATGFSRTEQFAYTHDSTKWVLGQATSVTDLGTGLVVSQTDYDATFRLPIRNYSFGALIETRAYRPDGTLLSVSDPAGHVTQLDNWHRGVPQQITFASSKTMTASVNNIGNLTATTDVLGSSSNYGYDAMGRLASIGYPVNDSVAWNQTARAFVSVPTAEFGIPANHWKQTVKTGNGWVTTYYDGRWNPVLVVTEDAANSASRTFVVKRFDSLGRETFSSYPVAGANVDDALKGVVTEYDALGRPYKLKQDSDNNAVLATTTEYLPGFQTRVTNPRGYQTTTSFQAFDSPSTDAPVRIVAPMGVTTTIVRDTFGKPLSITRSGPGG